MPTTSDSANRIFQQDKVRPHRVAVTTSFRDCKKLPFLCGQLELSAIEHVWSMVEDWVRSMDLCSRKYEVQTAWNSSSQHDIDHLIENLHRKVIESINIRRVSTRY